MPGHDVHRTAIAEHVERVLRNALPTEANELGSDRLDDPRMSAIDQPIGEPAAPAKLENRLDLQRGADATKPNHRDPSELAAFQKRDDLLVDVGKTRQIVLAQAQVLPYGSDQSPGTVIGHGEDGGRRGCTTTYAEHS